MTETASKPNVLVVMNDFRAPAGLLGEAIVERGGYYLSVAPGVGYSAAAPTAKYALPATDDGFDGLIVLGGPQRAGDDAGNPYFPPLLDVIRGFHAAAKPVMGVCLGAQLVARAFGERVFDQGSLEAGFTPLRLTADGRGDRLLEGLGPDLVLMQWHRDTFEVPDDAVLLATGPDDRNHAFRLGRATYAFQFHLEVTADIAREWVRKRREDIAEHDAGFFARFEGQVRDHMAASNDFARTVCNRWLDLIDSAGA